MEYKHPKAYADLFFYVIYAIKVNVRSVVELFPFFSWLYLLCSDYKIILIFECCILGNYPETVQLDCPAKPPSIDCYISTTTAEQSTTSTPVESTTHISVTTALTTESLENTTETEQTTTSTSVDSTQISDTTAMTTESLDNATVPFETTFKPGMTL